MSIYFNESGYLKLLDDTLQNGEKRTTRNGEVYSQFGSMIVFDNISEAFPLITTKKMFFRGICEELLWFLRGSTNSAELQEKGVHIWDGNSSREYLDKVGLVHYEENELGPIYGWQWRMFGKKYGNDNDTNDDNGIDQIKYIITELLKPDNSRRAVLTSWNPKQLHEMALPPCHILYTFYKDKNGLSCLMNMRSSDLFLGLPFNIASTALLTTIIATVLNIKVHKVALTLTDAHIYEEHIECVKKQMENEVNTLPTLNIKKLAPDITSTIDDKLEWIDSLQYDDFEVRDYKSAGAIKTIMK